MRIITLPIYLLAAVLIVIVGCVNVCGLKSNTSGADVSQDRENTV